MNRRIEATEMTDAELADAIAACKRSVALDSRNAGAAACLRIWEAEQKKRADAEMRGPGDAEKTDPKPAEEKPMGKRFTLAGLR